VGDYFRWGGREGGEGNEPPAISFSTPKPGFLEISRHQRKERMEIVCPSRKIRGRAAAVMSGKRRKKRES